MSSQEKLLDVAFEEIYHNGYSATFSWYNIKKANMNKGSMYHFLNQKRVNTCSYWRETDSHIKREIFCFIKIWKIFVMKL